MVALFTIILALICGLAYAQPVEPEPLPTVLQQPAYAALAVEPEPVPFQEMEIGCGDECVDCGPLVVQESYWYAGVDLLATRFSYHASSTASYDSQFLSNDDSALAVRPYLGWESSTGTGIRTRLWLFRGEVEGVIQPDYPPYYFWIDDYIGPFEIDSKSPFRDISGRRFLSPNLLRPNELALRRRNESSVHRLGVFFLHYIH